MDIKQLNYFLQLCDDLNFTLASTHLFISQQGLSMSITRLEKELNSTLFHRTSKGLCLTKAGQYLQNQAQIIVETANQCYSHFGINVDTIPVLRISSGADLLGLFPNTIQQILQNHNTQYPVDLKFAPGLRSESSLDMHECSLAFVCGPIDTDKYNSHLLMQREYRYLVNSKHPLAKYTTLEFSQMKDQQLIMPGPETKIYHEFTNLCKKNGFSANIAFESDRQILIYNIIKRDEAYVGQVLDYYTENLRDPEIQILKISDQPLFWKLYVIWRKDHILNSTEKNFINLLLDSRPKENQKTNS